MSETYCGKTCAECTQKEVLNCSGCKTDSDTHDNMNCELAKCCIDKGHNSCETCSFNHDCTKLMENERQPEIRLKQKEDAQKLHEVMANRSTILGKWLYILLWLCIPAIIAEILGNEKLFSVSPVYIIGHVLSFICFTLHGLILLKISTEDSQYRVAGICKLIVALLSLFSAIASKTGIHSAWLLIVALFNLIPAFFSVHQEFNAHSSVLATVNEELSNDWLDLWKWYVGSKISLFASIVFALFIPLFGLILVIISLFLSLYVSIMQLTQLYETSKVFREYIADKLD